MAQGDGTSGALMDPSEIGHARCYINGVETSNFRLSGDIPTLTNIEGEIKLILSLLAALELSCQKTMKKHISGRVAQLQCYV